MVIIWFIVILPPSLSDELFLKLFAWPIGHQEA
jgi:hypothetical protein